MQTLPARIAAGIVFVVLLFLALFANPVFAQPELGSQPVSSDEWKSDDEVTAVGKTAVRARQFLDWTLSSANANWVFLAPETSGFNELSEFWSLIRNIAYFLTLVIVLFSAFLIIITRGRSIQVRKQLIVIGGVLVLITFSFAFIQGIYRLTDTLQNFFLRLPTAPNLISTKDLLNIGFSYDFKGYRLIDPAGEEAANVAIFLVKATSITYYIMAGILLLRKIILWFFIILSPLWVLLLPFPLVRNTAKVWMGEFFRWLFYGPLFAVLLAGLVKLWQEKIPLNFTTEFEGGTYPTAISILLGGPGESVGLTNSINNINTYALYVIALLMLWVVMLLPFLLLKIFRDAIAGIFREDSAFLQKTFGALYPFLGRPPPGVPTPVTPPAPSGEGLAQQMNLRRPTALDAAREINITAQVANIESLPQVKTADIIKYAGLSVPSLRDVARMEMQRENLSQTQNLLRQISSPTNITNMQQRSRFLGIQQELLTRSKRGDAAATTILAAAESARTGQPVPIVVGGRPTVARQAAPLTASRPQLMPTMNRMQTVGIDDYEDVKKMWEENYRSGDVPISDQVKSREEWIKHDVTKIESVVELLSSINEDKKKQGLEALAVILPFLLLGGFSDQETVVYLKAKLEAAKKVLAELEQKTAEEDKVQVARKKEEEGQKELKASLPAEEAAKEGEETPPQEKATTLKEKIEGPNE